MPKKEDLSFIDYLKEAPDYRKDRKKLYPVEEIMLLTLCGLTAGADGWDDLEDFGEIKLEDLRAYFPFKNGTPSDDTLRRFFRTIDPSRFEEFFLRWIKSFQLDLEGKVIAIDGKTNRRSFDGEGKPVHLVSAFASEYGLTLGQIKTAEKSNEITAIPELLNLLDIEGSVVTLDAMGCQKKIVEQIVNQRADYVIGLKGNQGSLHTDVKLFFEKKPKRVRFLKAQMEEKGHGRIENRIGTCTANIAWFQKNHPEWSGLKSLIEIESHREIKGKKSVEKRYYISSLKAEPQKLMAVIRSHWGVENQLHWVLDVCFGEDISRIRKGNAPQNIAIMKKTVLNLMKVIKQTRPRTSFKRMRKMAGWDSGFMESILRAKF